MICYVTCLWSPVLWVRSYHQDCIIFGFSFYIQNLAKILVELEFWIFKSDPNLVVDISLNKDYSGDSNGGIYVSIPALGDENRNLPCFLFTYSSSEIPLGSRAILYTVGKVFMRRLQRRRNRRKRFSSGGESPGTSLANVNLRGGIDSRSLSRPLGGRNCDVRLPRMLP